MTMRKVLGLLIPLAIAAAPAHAAPAAAPAAQTPRAITPDEARQYIRSTPSRTATVELGWAYENGLANLPRDYGQALSLYKGNDVGGPVSAAHLNRLVAKLRTLTDQGDLDASVALAFAYTDGFIPGAMAANYAKAWPLYLKAAEAGHPGAINKLIYTYSTPHYAARFGVKEDPERELFWINKLVSRGSPSGYVQLSQHYRTGKIVPRNDAQAIELMRKAAVQEISTAAPADVFYINLARGSLGGSYLQGYGVPKDPKQALYWLRQGDPRTTRSTIEDLLLQYPELAEQEVEVTSASIAAPTQAPLTTSAAASPAAANGPRFALVVGNSAYTGDLGRLANPANDARLIAESLKAAGFQVQVITDADQRGMKAAIKQLGDRLQAAGPTATGLFYYAGHGVQAGGVNYLAPVNAVLRNEADLELEAVRADTALAQMRDAGARTSIVILDACRNMPLARSTRDATRGFARMRTDGGTYIAYSTAPGETAADGKGDNSPFSAALARHIRSKGQPIEVMFREVRAEVAEATKGAQTPWDTSSLTDDFVFTR